MYVKQFQANSQKSYFTQEQSCGNWLTALVQLKPITPTSFILYFHFYTYNVFMRLNTVPSFHLSCHCQELRRPRKMQHTEKQLFTGLKILLKYSGIVLPCGLVLIRQRKSQGEREGVRVCEVGKKAYPFCVDSVNQPPVQPISSQSTAALNEALRWDLS